jgi:DNA polymerase I
MRIERDRKFAARVPAAQRSSARFLARVLPGARPAAMPGFIPPCLPTLKDTPPAGPQWVHEIKFDGYRVQAQLADGRVRLYTRNGYDWTPRFARIAAAVRKLPVNKIVLDGEVVVQSQTGASDFAALVEDLDKGRQDRFVYFAFDLLHLDGFDITAAPLIERKRVLAALLAEAGEGPIAYSEHLEIEGEEMFRRAAAMGLEGIVSKRADSPYRSGRSRSWLKIKQVKRELLTIVGYAVSGDRLASLHVARRTGKSLAYAGQVGTGFSARAAADLIRRLRPLMIEEPSLAVPAPTARDRWVGPAFAAEIEYRDISEDRLLRHAAFHSLVREMEPSPATEPTARRAGGRTPPLLVVDGDSFAHRAYHAVPKTIRRAGDLGGGAILGFANYLLRFYESERPRAVLVGWDTLEAPTWRRQAFPAYQGGREFDAELVEQLGVLPEFVAACGFVNAKAAGFEADDFLAAAVAAEEGRGGTAVVATGDRDAFQLASATTTIVQPIRAGEMARIGPAEVRERYGVEPGQVPDFIALRGDPSDRIPGASGVGAKSAASLLRKYGTLEDALAAGRFTAEADDLRLYRRLATMDRSAPLPPLADQAPTWESAAILAREWGLNALAKRLAGLAGAERNSE